MSGLPLLPSGHSTRLSRTEAEWMIRDMGWTPEDFPSQGYTALMRARFSEAINAFSSQNMVQEAEALRHAPTAASDNAEAVMEVVDGIRLPTHTPSDSEAELAKRKDSPQTDLFDLWAPDSVSPDRCEEEPHAGQSSADPMDPPESKRQRPRSCLRWRSSPVLRQAAGLPHNGVFEDFAGLVLTRTATVILPSKEMVVMAMFRAIQCTPMPDVRQLTSCSRKWAAERPRCLSLTVKEADSLEAEQATQQREALLRAPFGITALANKDSQESSPLGRQLAQFFAASHR